MEPELIYAAGQVMSNKVEWSEWMYCGETNDVKIDFVVEQINSYFIDESFVLVSHTRQNSFEIIKEEFINATKEILGSHDFLVCDPNFTKSARFNKIGVFQLGMLK